jgi:hypothetical protein
VDPAATRRLHRRPRKFFAAERGRLVAYAEQQFRLAARQKDGATLREHLESAARQLGRLPEELVPLPCPEALTYLWNWWLSLAARRGCGFGPASLAWHDVEAWARLSGVTLEPFELDCLDALEQAYLRAQVKD